MFILGYFPFFLQIASLYNGTWYLGNCLGASLAGILYELVGFQWATTAATGFGIMVMCLCTFTVFKSANDKSSSVTSIADEKCSQMSALLVDSTQAATNITPEGGVGESSRRGVSSSPV